MKIISSIVPENQLNPKLWANNKLRPEVREKLLEIVDEFAESIDIPLVIIDTHIVGSNASYNYTEHSDLDVHCIVNYSRLDASPAIVEALMWSYKKLFNDKFDVAIRGIPVEIYVEDVNSNITSNGIYSLFKDEWIKFPEPITAEINDAEVNVLVAEIQSKIEQALNSQDSEEIYDAIDSLYMIRKNGLATDGEYGVGNQAFKEIRNRGYLDRLRDKVTELRSEELSIAASKIIK